MRWVWVAAGHWWTLGKCYSWWTQRWRGPEVSGPLSASGEEEAGCTQWWGLDCKHSLLLLMQKKVGRVRGERQRGERVVEVERKDIRATRGGEQKRSETSIDSSGTACQRLFGRDPHFTSKWAADTLHIRYIILPFKSAT